MISMVGATVGQPVRAREQLARVETSDARDFCTDHCLQWRVPLPTSLQRSAVELKIGGVGADDAKSFIAIAQCHRDGPFYKRLRDHFRGLGNINIACRNIDLKYRRQHKLERAAFGTDDQIDARRVAIHALLDL